jgi:hypothetical protein
MTDEATTLGSTELETDGAAPAAAPAKPPFKAGDVVCVVGQGNVDMTVEAVFDGGSAGMQGTWYAAVLWFDDSRVMQRTQLNCAILELY